MLGVSNVFFLKHCVWSSYVPWGWATLARSLFRYVLIHHIGMLHVIFMDWVTSLSHVLSWSVTILIQTFILFQIINVYNQEYESAAAFWPSVHGRIITALIISQFLLLGLLSTKGAGQSTPVLLVLPVVTFYFHKYCKNRYEPTFVKCPLQVMFLFQFLELIYE